MSNGVDVDRTGVPERSSARTRDVLGGTAHVNHIVQFYEADDFLASTVAHFIGSGLLAREPSIIIATPEHHEAFRHALDAASFDVERAHSAGQLVLLDAAQTLATFMVGDAPDWKLFEQNVGAVVARAIASMGGEGVTIRAYGEMVDLLWRRGNGAAAVRLEEMWNELAKHHSFSLLCAYGMTSFGDSEHAETFERVCKAHTHVLPTELYSDLATDDERLRRVGTLEQRSIALENEIHRRSVLERELRQALAATKRAEEDLRDFVENGLEGIHWVGPDGIVLFANQAELDLLGYTRDEYVGKHIRDFHVDDDVIDDILGCLSAGGTLRDREARLRCKDGSIKHVRIHSNVYRRNGKFVHTRCFTRDVTEQKEAEDALRGRTVELEATIRQFNAVVEQMPSAVAIVEAPSGKLLLSNTRSAEIFRLPLAPLADVSAYRRFVGLHEDGRELEPEEWPLARSIATGEVVSGQEIRIVRGDGTRGYIRVSSAPIRDGDGNIVNGVVTYEDVSDEKDAANALREQSRINENLVRIGASLSSELNLDVLVQRVTDEATALCRAQFGAFFHNVVDDKGESYMLYTLSGVPREAFSKFPMPRNTAIFAATFDGEGVVRSDDITKDPRYGKSAPYHGMPQGHLPVCSYLAVPVKSRSGEVLGGLFFGHAEPGRFTEADERLVVAVAAQAAIAIDNAKLFDGVRRAREATQEEREKLAIIAGELERANRTKDEFLATVSHELRTPLNAILGWVRMLRMGSLAPEKRERALETIERNANNQTQLIEDLLDVSRIISGKLRLDVGSVDLPSVVENAIEVVRPAAEAKGLAIRQTIDPNAGPILGDAQRLQQVLWNLLTNAVKFTAKGGSIHVAVRKRDSHVEIIVADDGQGIAPDFVTMMFERFRQADATPARKHGGLGLGLAIVRSLVELHGGTVKAESAGLGDGATFTVCLPISPLRSRSLERPPALRLVTTSSPQFECPQNLDGVHVLVVDDEVDARELLREMLSSCKARVDVASSVAEAIAFVEEHQPDVVVSDIGMPGEDGYVLIRKLRALPAAMGGRTPAVALTAYARFEDRTKALVAGFNMHVPKPVEPTELLAVLSSLTTMFAEARA